MGEIREFSASPFLLHLMFDQTLSDLIVFSDDFTQNYIYELHKRAILQWILRRFDSSQNEFEMRLPKKSNRGWTFKWSPPYSKGTLALRKHHLYTCHIKMVPNRA